MSCWKKQPCLVLSFPWSLLHDGIAQNQQNQLCNVFTVGQQTAKYDLPDDSRNAHAQNRLSKRGPNHTDGSLFLTRVRESERSLLSVHQSESPILMNPYTDTHSTVQYRRVFLDDTQCVLVKEGVKAEGGCCCYLLEGTQAIYSSRVPTVRRYARHWELQGFTFAIVGTCCTRKRTV
jgi:hypothetical protein